MTSIKPDHIFPLMLTFFTATIAVSQINEPASPVYHITLKEAHIGSLEIDTMLLQSYGTVPSNIKEFHLFARNIFREPDTDFTDKRIISAALDNNISLLGGPMLGNLKPESVSLWLRPASINPLTIKVMNKGDKSERTYRLKPDFAGREQRIELDGLYPETEYEYVMLLKDKELVTGTFSTVPKDGTNSRIRIAFGSGFHKIGLHNPNLMNTIVNRRPHAMLLLGDLAVDDRDENLSMHRSDYLLRDLSKPWQKLAANVALYASWDDHDYRNNDLSGVSDDFTDADREKLRKVWKQNWNNPPADCEGIYFNTRLGQVEVIMLDTRSFRINEERGEYGSYLGKEQLEWLKATLKNSEADFKIVSSGTMWSDYISDGKDSWGTWDTIAREEIFELIEKENIPGILWISGDRHGARGFTIPRKSGFQLYEFEAASLGGVPGPDAMAEDRTNQLFGYKGLGLKAFGEFTFYYDGDDPKITFRLIDELGKIMEEHTLPYEKLIPKGQ